MMNKSPSLLYSCPYSLMGKSATFDRLGDPIQTPKCHNPNYRDPQESIPNFECPPHRNCWGHRGLLEGRTLNPKP